MNPEVSGGRRGATEVVVQDVGGEPDEDSVVCNGGRPLLAANAARRQNRESNDRRRDPFHYQSHRLVLFSQNAQLSWLIPFSRTSRGKFGRVVGGGIDR